MTSPRLLLAVLLVTVLACEAAPFFDALYDAINGNGRSYGYSGYRSFSGYGNYEHNGYHGNGAALRPIPEHHENHRRPLKSWKDVCRVHFPDSVAQPGKGGITCPYR
ncbi:hypothetical protein ABMA28_014085 [Loxostege sticticalis]|uniref:Uncharacterized protein n=1 Tax=Loxostege sticticalis TaxID=481309 RepID=A0ABD0TFK0_LOXSC